MVAGIALRIWRTGSATGNTPPDFNDWRTFRVDRIERLISAGPQFTPGDLPEDLATYVSRSIAHSPYRLRMRLKPKGSADALVKHVPSWCGVLEAVDDESCLSGTGGFMLYMLKARSQRQALGPYDSSSSHCAGKGSRQAGKASMRAYQR